MPKDQKAMHPTLRVAKDAPEDGIVTLSSGVRARLRPVSARLVDEVAAMIPEPKVPKQFVESKGREEYNPLDPDYLDAVRAANRERGLRVTETLIMFGLELLDPVPETASWLPKLQYLEKRGTLSLAQFNFDDPLDREFVYKCYVAVGNEDLRYVSMASGLTDREVAKAVANFPGKKARSADSGGGAST